MADPPDRIGGPFSPKLVQAQSTVPGFLRAISANGETGGDIRTALRLNTARRDKGHIVSANCPCSQCAAGEGFTVR